MTLVTSSGTPRLGAEGACVQDGVHDRGIEVRDADDIVIRFATIFCRRPDYMASLIPPP